ncbi:MAG: hypothetical protein AAFP97_00515 [Pseudomonadota bacterium]
MKSLTKNLAVATVAAAAFTLPATASAADYRKCNDTETAVVGGLVGGSLGTIIGEEIAGRGNRTEGAVAGALIGGVVGAAIGDSVSNCEKDGVIYRDGRIIGTQTGFRTVDHRRHSNDRKRYYNDRGRHYNDRHRQRDFNDRRRNRGFGYTAQQHDRDLRRIERRMDRLRAERRDLKNRRHYGQRRGVERRLRDIAYELDFLKDERRRLKRLWDQSRRHNHRRHDYNYK